MRRFNFSRRPGLGMSNETVLIGGCPSSSNKICSGLFISKFASSPKNPLHTIKDTRLPRLYSSTVFLSHLLCGVRNTVISKSLGKKKNARLPIFFFLVAVVNLQ